MAKEQTDYFIEVTQVRAKGNLNRSIYYGPFSSRGRAIDWADNHAFCRGERYTVHWLMPIHCEDEEKMLEEMQAQSLGG